MPRPSTTETWVKEFRLMLYEQFTEDARWSVGEHRNSLRLQVIHNGIKQTRVLPFEWSREGCSKAFPEILQIYKRFYEGKTQTLAEACEKVKVSSSQTKLDIEQLINDFKKFVPNASDKTWKKSYLPVLYKSKELLERSKGKPLNGEELMLASLEQWEQGTRMRQIQRRSLKKFLDWAILRAKLPATYAPPASIPEIRKPKKIGYAFSDQQILALINDETDEKWKFCYQLCAVYGLRPEELRHLKIMDGTKGKELWSTYRKSMGGLRGDKTKPRKLAPLFVKDADGNLIDWKLQQRLEIGEELPPLGQEGKGSEAIRTHLRRRKLYQQIKEEARKLDQECVPYSFRHRYAKESHANGAPTPNIAEAMGHTVPVHMQNYARFTPDATTEIYDRINKVVA